jgi:hypothetical protein
MKTISFALAIAASLTIITTANAWLGDSEPTLVQRYGHPRAVEIATGEIPTQKGFYAELTESFTTNVSLTVSTNDDYDLDLVETRQRDTFTKDGQRIVVYIGNVGEKYNGVDFSGSSTREVFHCPIVWGKNTHGDKVGRFVFFSPTVVNTLLQNNQGNSTWSDGWHTLPLVAGIYFKYSPDRSRMAIAYGLSENEIYRLEFRMENQSNLFAD